MGHAKHQPHPPIHGLGGVDFLSQKPPAVVVFLVIFSGGSEVFFIGYSEIGLSTLAFITTIHWIIIRPKNQSLLLFIGMATIWLSHPAGCLYFPIIALFGWKNLPLKQTLSLALSLAAVFIAKQLIAPSNPYDAQLYGTLINVKNFTQFTNLFSVNYLLHASWFSFPPQPPSPVLLSDC